MQILVTTRMLSRTTCWILIFLASLAGHALAQSTDVAWPSPVRTPEVVGTIVARDLGDPRLTDHFYAFTGTPGDLLITIDSRNLNGDIDVFTFSGLRPLLKFTVYAGSSGPITKGIYLRAQEDLILRVEGRTPNDDEAVYRIHFGGSFAPITSGPLAEHEDAIQPATTAGTSTTGGRRVSAVGARIDEPRTEVVAAPTPEPTPVETPEPKPTPAKRTARNTRPRRPAPAPRKTRPTEAAKPEETATTSDTANKPPDENPEPAPRPAAKERRPTRRSPAKSTAARKVESPPENPEPEPSGPRLLIETSDGTFVDRYMTTVRRVTVENGQVVVVGKDGKVLRVPLASVVKMTIAP